MKRNNKENKKDENKKYDFSILDNYECKGQLKFNFTKDNITIEEGN